MKVMTAGSSPVECKSPGSRRNVVVFVSLLFLRFCFGDETDMK